MLAASTPPQIFSALWISGFLGFWVFGFLVPGELWSFTGLSGWGGGVFEGF